MVDPAIKDALLEKLEHLPLDGQRRVLDFADALLVSLPRGVPGKDLLHLAGTISAGDAELMRQAIEKGCERIDPRDW